MWIYMYCLAKLHCILQVANDLKVHMYGTRKYLVKWWITIATIYSRSTLNMIINNQYVLLK